MTRLLFVAALLALALSVGWAADNQPAQTQTVLIKLKHLDARQVAWVFGGEPGPTFRTVDPAAARRDFAERLRSSALEIAEPAPETMREAGLYLFPMRASVGVELGPPAYQLPFRDPKPAGRGIAALLPDGLTEGPVAFIDDNAVIVRGTTQAIDEFREIVALLDKPAKQVSLSVRLLVLPEPGEHGLRVLGVLPGGSESGEADSGPVPSVVANSNSPVIVRTGLAVPFVAAPGDGQPGSYRVGAAVDAREFIVLPRVNADASVSLIVVPADRVVREAPWAEQPGPAGVAPPLSPGVSLVRVGDGETAVFGGFPRAGELLAREDGRIRAAESGASVDAQALLLITARIVPDGEVRAALPR